MKNIKPAKPTKQEALANAWAENLYRVIQDGENFAEDLESKLKAYAGQDPTALTMALIKKVQLGSTGQTRKEATLLHFAMLRWCLLLEGAGKKNYKKAMELFLHYGPQGHLQQQALIIQFFDAQAVFVKSPHDFVEILEVFFKYPDNMHVRGHRNETFAHVAARHDLESLKYIYRSNPALFEMVDVDGRSPIFTAIECNEPCALWMINEAVIDIHAQDNSNRDALFVAVQLEKINIVRALIANHCAFDLTQNIVINASSSLIPALSESGYFLRFGLVECDAHEAIRRYFKDKDFSAQPFFTVRQSDKDVIVRTAAELEALVDMPDEQRQRLHYAFKLTVDFLEKKEGVNADLSEMYAVMKRKFPLDQSQTAFIRPYVKKSAVTNANTASASGTSVSSSDPLLIFGIVLLGVLMKNPNDPNHWHTGYNTLLETTKTPEFYSVTKEYLHSSIEEFYLILFVNFEIISSCYKQNDEVKDLFSDYMNLFIDSIIVKYLKMASKNDITQVHSKLMFFISTGFSLSVSLKKYAYADAAYLLSLIMDVYREKQMPMKIQDQILFLVLIEKIPLYIQNEFYDELIDVFNDLLKMEHIYLDDKANCLDVLMGSINKSFDLLKKENINIKIRLGVLDQIEIFIHKKCFHKHASKPEIVASCQSLRKVIEQQYAEACERMLPVENAVLKCQLDVARKRVEIVPLIDIQHTNFGKVVRGIDHVQHVFSAEKNRDVYFFEYIGYETDVITDVLRQLRAMNADHISRREMMAKDDLDSCSQENPLKQPSYLPSYDAQVSSTRTTVGKGKKLIDLEPASATGSQKQQPTHNLEILARDVIQALGVPNDADVKVFSLHHPGFPDSRKHLCWACWIPDSLDGGQEFAGQAERYQELLMNNGRFVHTSFGENGLKGIRYLNEDTGYEEETYELKLAKENPRVIAYPCKVMLSTNEKALVLCFGTVMNHKQLKQDNLLRLSPQRFLQECLGVNHNNHNNKWF